MSTDKPVPRPKPPASYGKLPGFGRPIRVEPGACPVCGAYPPCEPPKGKPDGR